MLLFLFSFTILFLLTVACVGFGQSILVSSDKQQIRKMLRHASTSAGKRRQDLLWTDEQTEGFAQNLKKFSLFQSLELRISQAGLDWALEKFVILSFTFAFVGFLLGEVLPLRAHLAVAPLIVAAIAGTFPLMNINRKRTKRFAEFEEQFPEALNFLSRSMRAGHAFSIGLEMLVADAPDPLATCFRRVLSNLQLGSPMEESLAELVETMPLIDVRFFVSSVLLQQGTGGNLGEVLDTMAHIIRDRFRLKGAVKAASAHGKITGLVLSLMPIVVGVLLLLVSPAYILQLFVDPLGKKMLIGSAVAQAVGFICIRKITNIKV